MGAATILIGYTMHRRFALVRAIPTASPSAVAKAVTFAGILIGLASSPALADAITYTGTLGGQDIVLELTELEDGPLLGRYSYLSVGADIPLHVLNASEDGAVLAEEQPCTPALCERPDGNLLLDAPLGGQFDLRFSLDHTTLTGTWRASVSDEVPQSVDLVRFGVRTYSRDDAFPYGSFLWVNYDNAAIMPQSSPYDYAKMQVPLIEGPLLEMGGATYREVSDPRTMFDFPRVTSLPGGGDTTQINAALDQRRWAINFAGLECLGADYLSGVWMPTPFGTGGHSLGGIDQESFRSSISATPS